MFRWTGSIGLLAVALTLACAIPAGATTGFLTDDTLANATTGTTAVAMAPNGYAIVAWVERPSGQVVHVTTRPPGGTWTSAETFPVSLDSAFTVSVAIASSGAAAVAWEEVTSPSTFDVAVASRPAGGAFTSADVLRDAVRQVLDPSVGIAADGTVTLLYANNPNTVVRDFPAGRSVLAATEQPLAASCSPGFGRGIAEAPSGDAVVPLYCGGASFALRRGGSWAVSPTVPNDNGGGGCSSTTSYDAASVAIDAAGEPVGVLQRTSTQRFDIGFCQTFSTTIDASLVLPLGGFMTAVPGPPAASGTTFSSFGFPLSGPTAAISPSGIVFAWADTPQLGRAQQKARFFATDGSGGSAPQPVGAESTGAGAPALAVAADGRALLAWLQFDRPGGTLRLLVSERPPGGTFGDPSPIDAAGASLSAVAMADGGDGLAAWTVGTSAPYELHVRGYDATAPSLSGVSIPSIATVGVPAAFSASPFDVWGPLTMTWSFGDGTSATGAAVQHAYARAGAFTASVTSTDAVGNAVTRSASVQVAGGVGGPPIRGLSLTHRRFRVGRAPTAASARRRHARRPPVGTTFRFALERAASVTVAFAKQANGLRSGRRCVKPTRRLRRAHGRRCTRLVAVRPQLTRAARAGANAVPFSGRIGRRALAPGRYVATLTATAAGRAGPPSSIRFTVVR